MSRTTTTATTRMMRKETTTPAATAAGDDDDDDDDDDDGLLLSSSGYWKKMGDYHTYIRKDQIDMHYLEWGNKKCCARKTTAIVHYRNFSIVWYEGFILEVVLGHLEMMTKYRFTLLPCQWSSYYMHTVNMFSHVYTREDHHSRW